MLGFRDFGVGLYQGVTGILTAPIEGAQKDGAIGLLTGIGKGLTGAVMKPMVLKLCLVFLVAYMNRLALLISSLERLKESNTQHNWVKNKESQFDHRDISGPIISCISTTSKKVFFYSTTCSRGLMGLAFGQDLMNAVFEGKHKSQYYLYHVQLSESQILLVTTFCTAILENPMFQALSGKWAIQTATSNSSMFPFQTLNLPPVTFSRDSNFVRILLRC